MIFLNLKRRNSDLIGQFMQNFRVIKSKYVCVLSTKMFVHYYRFSKQSHIRFAKKENSKKGSFDFDLFFYFLNLLYCPPCIAKPTFILLFDDLVME